MTYLVVFQHIFRVDVPNFLAFFLVGLLMWIFFARSIATAATCVLDDDAMVKKAPFIEVTRAAILQAHGPTWGSSA